MAMVDFDWRAIRIDGQRKLLISGAIHYPRSTPAMWPELFKRSREAGLNTIETYVFWNLHETIRGQYDFTGRLDLERFCREAQEAGLHVVLRIGPYICAETNYGGLPSWLRDEPGIQMRTENQPFQEEMGRFVTDLCKRLRPLFAPQGGPIILSQIENEYNNISKRYGEAGKRYLDWAVEMGRGQRLGVPWVMCAGAAAGAIETINGFYGHEYIEDHFKRNHGQPALWTEDWIGWYDTWGHAPHSRTAQDIAFGAAEFFAAGGTGINYYMWHGGTNFGRESMYLQTTAYFPQAPLNEYGQETTTSRHLAKLHRILHQHSAVILANDPPDTQKLDAGCTARSYGQGQSQITFLSNTTETATVVSFASKEFSLKPRSVQILDSQGKLLLDTAIIDGSDRVVHSVESEPTRLELVGQWTEPFPTHRHDTPIKSDTPLDQLSLTRDQNDYCWYSTTITGGTGELLLEGVADYVRIFIDSQPVASSTLPLLENREITTGKGFRQSFPLELRGGQHRLDILCCALGLIKGDWMLDANMVEEKKGIFGSVTWRGQTVTDWEHRAGLVGKSKLSKPTSLHPGQPMWWKLQFQRPAGNLPLVVDLSGLEKGLAWLNTHCIGRYWLAPAAGRNPITPGNPVEVSSSPGPTQHLYHLPQEWLSFSNELILFEETSKSPEKISLKRIKGEPLAVV